jgi:glutathione S-transferase
MITFYQFGNSVCCQKVRITMQEKRLTWDAIEVNLFRNEQYSPDYLKINPKGVVPALVHNGRVITESTLICEYLDDVYPEPPLIPKDPFLRASMRKWSKLVDEGLHEGLTDISFSAMFRERLKNSTQEERDVRFRNIGDPRRRDRFVSTYELGACSPFVLHAVAAFHKAFKFLGKTLAERGPWILGPSPSLADINLMPYVARLEFLGLLDVFTTDRPTVRDWWKQAREWPSYVAGIATPMKKQELEEMGTHGPKIRRDIEELIRQVESMQTVLQPSGTADRVLIPNAGTS